MRMTDAAPAEAMRVCEAANVASTPREREALEQSPQSREEHSGDDKIDTQPVKFSKPSAKLKLVRSLAVCEESPPAATTPEPIEALQDGFCLQTCQPFDKEEWSTKDETEKENAYDTVDKPRKMLSRDSSQDYTDSTGIDLHEFLVNTLKNNPRDRIMLLKLEQDILDFISNNESQKRKFPPMTSYHRMLLHRVAAYFGMDHNVDPSGKSVIINKTANSRIPDQKFSEHITDDRVDDFQKRYILKRDNSSFDRQDSVGDHFVLDKRSQNGEACLSSQQRRHMFSLRAGRSGASRQSSSETEATARYSELRPWSSTDSSDSSNRLAPRPPITKASSFSGTSTGLVRGDSTASSKSTTGRLSKTGSESSSVGSSSSSLSRSQLPLPAPAQPRGNGVPSTPAALPNAEAKASPCRPEVAAKAGPALQPAPSAVTTAATNFYLVPLESTGMPPGATVLVNTHTGLPLVNSDGSAVVYNPATAAGHAHMVGSRPQQAKTPHQPTAATAAQQQPTTNHLLSQPFRSPFQSSSTVPVQYSTVSYPPPPPTLPPSTLPPPPQFLPICPNQQYTVPETLNAQFSHVSLARQPPGDGSGGAADAPHHHFPPMYHHHHHHHASPVMIHAPPHLQQVAGYMLAAAGPPGGFQGGLPGHHHHHLPALAPAAPYSNATANHPATHAAYPGGGGGTPGPAAAYPSGPAMNQQFVQQHTYIQQPVPQVTTCYCAPANYPQCSGQQQHHHYRPSVTPLPYNCPPSQHLPQQQAYATMMPNSVPGYQTVMGVQPATNPTLAGGQQSNMGNQMQGMMVQYPPMPSYQQVLVPQGSQMVSQQSYQQPVMYSCQQGQGAVPVASMQPCYNLLSPNQHTTMSSTVSFLPAQAVEQLQFPQAASPCVSQQHTGQQYTGVLPPPPGSGMVMMQVSVPSSHQPRPHSPCQRKPFGHKYPGQEPHRSRRLTEPLAPLESPQSRVQLASSPAPSPVPSPSPGHLGGLKGLPSGLSAISIMSHQHQHHHHHLPPAFYPNGQGEGHYSLLGQPLQYKPPMGPPLIHATHMMANHQGHMGIWHGTQGRRTSRKTVTTDLSVGQPVSGRILEVTDLPEGISCSEAHRLLGELCRGGAMIKWLSERQPRPQDQSVAKKQESPVQELPPGSCKPPRDLASS